MEVEVEIEDEWRLKPLQTWPGFEFQVEKDLQRVYLGEVGHAKEYETSPGSLRKTTYFKNDDHKIFINLLRNKLLELIPGIEWSNEKKKNIWITDWLGHNYLTIHIDHYYLIHIIINFVTVLGYRIITTTQPKAMFLPGDKFSERNLELKIIETMRQNFDMANYSPVNKYGLRSTWEHVLRLGSFGPVTKLKAWTTPEGKAFCRELRTILNKTIPTEEEIVKHVIKKYDVTQIADAKEILDKQVKELEEFDTEKDINDDENEDDNLCLVCMDAPATTTVLPCECRVVCDECSIGLRKTADNATCAKCRNPITFVTYSDNTLEEK